jgi:beta-aspartyl-peptidase (threonine type)
MVVMLLAVGCAERQTAEKAVPVTLVIHGGAGTILRENMTPEKEREYRDTLSEALRSGIAILEKGGSGLDAVETAIRIMEDSPLFNAGKGAVFTNQGMNEMDASIMNGTDLNAGAVASVTTIRNPIRAARAVMTHSKHVMLSGRGAEVFAAEQGLDIVDPEYFFTQRRWDALLRAKEKAKESESSGLEVGDMPYKYGTVGAIALDSHGNIVTGTSTGGLTNKLYGRVGDSPIIGAGTYADNKTCGVSGTGQGEYFMRGLLAYSVSVLMEVGGMSLKEAADQVIHKKLTGMGGEGGLVALDRDGNVAMPFNTAGMYRGYVRAGEEPRVFIYKDE